MKYYVYELVDPRFDQVFYVGKGSNNRIDHHEAQARNPFYQGEKVQRIREIWDAGFQIEKRKVKHFADEKAAYEHEAQLIAHYTLENLCNISRGIVSMDQLRKRPDRNYVACDHLSDKTMIELYAKLYYRAKSTNWIATEFVKDGVKTPIITYEAFNEVALNVIEPLIRKHGLQWVNDVSNKYGIIFNYANGKT